MGLPPRVRYLKIGSRKKNNIRNQEAPPKGIAIGFIPFKDSFFKVHKIIQEHYKAMHNSKSTTLGIAV